MLDLAKDVIKYVTVYENAFSKEDCATLIDSFYTAPYGNGYLLTPAEEWEDQDGLRRRPLFEYYRDPEDLDLKIFGSPNMKRSDVSNAHNTLDSDPYRPSMNPVFKDFDAKYDLVKQDDTAYAPMMKVLAAFKEATTDYLTRWDLGINIIQHAPLEFRYYQGPQGVGPHSDYSGHLHLHPRGTWGNQESKEDWDIPNQTFAYNLYLNDDYGDGGEIFVRRYAKDETGKYIDVSESEGSHKPKAGDIVIFPCAFPYEHWVTPIGENVKRWMVNANAIEDRQPMWQFN